jgi:phosphate transport system substrate-binding protein
LRIKTLLCVATAAVGFSATAAVASASATTLSGAGSTLIAPLEHEWATAWGSATGNTINYAAVGSGSGEKDANAGSVTFGASDAPAAAYPGSCATCKWIPWALTATGIGYNIKGVKNGLHLTGKILGEIYDGQITNWDSSQIKAINKGKKLPNQAIAVFFRSDGSGDSWAFTNYLSKVYPTITQKIGSASIQPSFPVGAGKSGNSGVASAVKSTPGGIGYISASYLIAQGITTAYVENAKKYFAPPGLSNIAAAATGKISTSNPDVQNSSGKYAYPIATFTNIIIPGNPQDVPLLQSFITYALTSGRNIGEGIDFAPIPKGIQSADLSIVNGL